jgi:hypothetical protein
MTYATDIDEPLVADAAASAAHASNLAKYDCMVARYSAEYGFRADAWPYPACLAGESLEQSIHAYERTYC